MGKRDKQWYDDVMKEDDLSKYYKGSYKERNMLVVDFVKSLNIEKNIIDIAAGSFQVMNLLSGGYNSYHWNDFSEVFGWHGLEQNIKVTHDDIETAPDDYFKPYNVFICVSMEHIEHDIEMIRKLNVGTYVVLGGCNFGCDGHVRFWPNVEKFAERYNGLVQWILKKTVHHIYDQEKYVIFGQKQ